MRWIAPSTKNRYPRRRPDPSRDPMPVQHGNFGRKAMRRHGKTLVVLASVLVLGLAVAFPDLERLPVQPGTAEAYWNAAAGVRKQVVPSGSWSLVEPVN